MTPSRPLCRFLVLLALFACGVQAADGAREAARTKAATGPTSGPGRTAIASAHWLATEAGHEIIAAGGNALDAAAAAAMALAVVEPASAGIGGGASFPLHRASDGKDDVLDARAAAPAAASPDWYRDD